MTNFEANLAGVMHTLPAFLDIEGVFNNVTTSRIEDSLGNMLKSGWMFYR